MVLAFIALSCWNLLHDHFALVGDRTSVLCSRCVLWRVAACGVLLVLPHPPAPSGRRTLYGQSSLTRHLVIPVFLNTWRNNCNDSFGSMLIDTYTLGATGWKLVQIYLKCTCWAWVYICCEPSLQSDAPETPSHTNNCSQSESVTPWCSCSFSL